MKPQKIINATIIELRKQNYNLFYMDMLSVFELLNITNALYSHNKIAMELMSTLIFSAILKKRRKNIIGVGVPCIKGKIDGKFNLSLSFIKKIAIERSDIDTIILEKQNDEIIRNNIQVVRYKYQQKVNTEDFYKFLYTKKLTKYKKDDKLHLLVNIEDSISFEYKKINSMLLNTAVPFATIFALGHIGPNNSYKFISVKLYPSVEGPIIIDFSKPPPG